LDCPSPRKTVPYHPFVLPELGLQMIPMDEVSLVSTRKTFPRELGVVWARDGRSLPKAQSQTPFHHSQSAWGSGHQTELQLSNDSNRESTSGGGPTRRGEQYRKRQRHKHAHPWQ